MGEGKIIPSVRRETRNQIFISNKSQGGKGSECSFVELLLYWALSVATDIPHFIYICLSGSYNEAHFIDEQTEPYFLT